MLLLTCIAAGPLFVWAAFRCEFFLNETFSPPPWSRGLWSRRLSARSDLPVLRLFSHVMPEMSQLERSGLFTQERIISLTVVSPRRAILRLTGPSLVGIRADGFFSFLCQPSIFFLGILCVFRPFGIGAPFKRELNRSSHHKVGKQKIH